MVFLLNPLTPYPHICASQKTGFLYGLPITDLFEIVQPIKELPVLSNGVDYASLFTLVELWHAIKDVVSKIQIS